MSNIKHLNFKTFFSILRKLFVQINFAYWVNMYTRIDFDLQFYNDN